MLARTWQRGFALALVLASLVLIAISAYAFLINLGQGHKDSESVLFLAANGHVNQITKQQAEEFLANDKRPTLSLEMDRLALADKHLQGSLRFDVSQTVQSELVDANTGKQVFQCDKNQNCTNVKPQYADKKIQLVAIGTSSEPGSEFEFTKEVPLKDIGNSVLGRVVYPIDMPLTGFPNLYPQDYYFFDTYLIFSWPNGIIRQVNGKDPTGADADHYVIDPGNVGESQNVAIKPLVDAKNKPVEGQFHVSLKRKTISQIYIYSVAMIPLMFALLFLHLLFFSRHFQHKIFEEFTEALIVAILAVLPLRVVLVPSQLEELTRVDLVLGMGLVLIVAVAMGKYASEVWGASAEPYVSPVAPHSAESHVAAPAE